MNVSNDAIQPIETLTVQQPVPTLAPHQCGVNTTGIGARRPSNFRNLEHGKPERAEIPNVDIPNVDIPNVEARDRLRKFCSASRGRPMTPERLIPQQK
ncbi:hypothetical protein [Streptomyces sp. KR80]|uniref:hypothetical protein n=1 Tax=Streptomyces sp. KR80 TaxID=3457426 RepID=UPI003FD3C3B5